MDTQTLPLTACAQVWNGGSEFRNLSVDLPTPAQGEALATIDLATICGSDIHTISGRRPGPHPGILGHEAVGRITSIGPGGVKDFRGRQLQPGDRVIWSVTVACGQCARCQAGVTVKCVELLKTGHEPLDGGWGLSGGYSSHIHLRRGITMVSVPETVSDAAAAPVACATATVMAVMEAAGALAAKRVLISGAGMLGIVACAVAQHRGASAVHVRDINPERLALAREFGATDAAAPNADRPGLAVDIAVDVSGAAQAVESAFASLDIKGRMVLAGSVSPGPAVLLDPERMVRSLLTVTGVHNYEPKHLQEAMDFVHETRDTYQWGVLVEEPCALAELPFLMQPPTGRSLRKSVTPNAGTIRRTS
ncbi:zinc-binding dehydrogenase [Paenarthrobacter sp. FR1]|uniref:zinc-binding dehydrogenase n=1 Tax=Paenarthrobacter sp. FR1 TaxID=3439548 RepID=UPI003DA312E4